MKKIALIVGLVVLATLNSFAALNRSRSSGAKLEGLFGVKFGDRMPSSMMAIPSPDGTLVVQLEPKQPEFDFQEYYACIHAQTRAVLGLTAVNTYEIGESLLCNEEYSKSRKAIERRFGKGMDDIPAGESGLGDAQTVVKNCAMELPGQIFILLQTLKDPVGIYSLRFIALDIGASKEPIKQSLNNAKSLPSLNSLFGLKLGQKAPISFDEVTLADGLCIQCFEPEKKFLGYDTYFIKILPKSRKICEIGAFCDFESRFSATECFDKTCQLLEKKFCQKMNDVSYMFDSSKPDEDGKMMLKCALISFPNSLRYLEVDCLKDVDDNVFRVGISASDQSLANTLETERKAGGETASDAEALDAL